VEAIKVKPLTTAIVSGFDLTTALVGTSHRPQWCAVKEGSDVIRLRMISIPG